MASGVDCQGVRAREPEQDGTEEPGNSVWADASAAGQS